MPTPPRTSAQLALSVRARRKSALVHYIEPGADSVEFAAQRMGCAASEVALLKNALRESALARAAAGAARQSDSRRDGDAQALQARIATLERALKEARAGEAATEAAAQKIEAERREEVGPLKRRIATLERSLKQQVALGEEYKSRLEAQRRPDPEGIPAGTA